jgi:elongator complex protein 2
MILDASWTPLEQPTFMTAGRDKSVKTWQITEADVQLKSTATVGAAVTAVSCSSELHQGSVLFAFGTENGEIGICKAATDALDNADITMLKGQLCPAKTVNQVVWRPCKTQDQQQVAVVSDDTSMRLYDIKAV